MGNRSRGAIVEVAVLVALFLGALACGRGEQPLDRTGQSPTAGSQASAPVSLAPTSTTAPITDDELMTWIATLPEGPPPDVATLSGRYGSYQLVDRGLRVAVPADTLQLYGQRTPHGLVVRLLTEDQAAGYTDDYFVSYLFLLTPQGRLLPVVHTLMGGVATDPSGRYVAWLKAGVRERDPHTVHVVDLTTLREVTHFDEPAWSTVSGWISSGILISQGGAFSVHALDGREVHHPQPLVGAAADRVLIQDAGCLRVLDLQTGVRTPPFGCTVQRTFSDGGGTGTENVQSLVALSPDGKWMIVDGLSVEVDTLTVRGALMPAGIQRQQPAFLPLDTTHLWGKIKNDSAQTLVTLVCDLPAARCQKTPEPMVGVLW